MPRPSMKEQRTEEILDAFERCIVKVGLHGSSLEVIAEEANMKRSILRHYIGNRDEIIEALAERVIGRFGQETDELMRYLPEKNQPKALVELLFYGAKEASVESLAVTEALQSVSAQNEKVRDLFANWLDQFVGTLSTVLERAYPQQKAKHCWAAAYGVASIYFSHEAMTPLNLPKKFERGAKDSALALVLSLEG